MIVLPVIVRELRSASRHAFTYYLRVVGAAAALLGSMFFGATWGFNANLGGALFAELHLVLFFAIWLLVPLLTADCISRERREGTLGLMFLTRLRATDIVIAKSLAHGLRGLTLWLAVMPMVAIPMLLGGVSGNEAAVSALVNFSMLCWALAAGLLASSLCKSWLRSLVGAAVLAVAAFPALAGFAGLLLFSKVSASPAWVSRVLASPDFTLVQGLEFLLRPAWGITRRGMIGTRSTMMLVAPVSGIVGIAVQLAVISMLVLMLAILLAGRRTRRSWQEEPPSRLRRWWERTFCTPVICVALFKRWMRRKLARNPIGWLQQRTWSGRLVMWGWFAVVMSIYSAVLTDSNFFRQYSGLQLAIAWIMSGSVAMSAAGSLRRERETGVMELLLVSPVGEGQIIWGRLRGLWGQFLPAFGLLLGLWAYFSSLPYLGTSPDHSDAGAIAFFAATFFALPVIGLYFSLRCRNYMSALVATLAVGLLTPIIISILLWSLFVMEFAANSLGGVGDPGPSASAAVFQVVVAIVCAERLRHRLRNRSFPMERTGA